MIHSTGHRKPTVYVHTETYSPKCIISQQLGWGRLNPAAGRWYDKLLRECSGQAWKPKYPRILWESLTAEEGAYTERGKLWEQNQIRRVWLFQDRVEEREGERRRTGGMFCYSDCYTKSRWNEMYSRTQPKNALLGRRHSLCAYRKKLLSLWASAFSHSCSVVASRFGFICPAVRVLLST